MTDGTSAPVECPVCGEDFDPTAAGGWCTNSECGEWQYIGEEVPEPPGSPSTTGDGAGDADGESETTPAIRSVDDGDDAATADADRDGTSAGTGGATTTDTDDGATTDADDGATTGVDDGVTTADTAENGTSAPDTDSATGPDDAAAESGADEVAADTEPTCPDCGSEVGADDSFCSACGGDLETVEAPTLEECPDCGDGVTDEDSFCANCGADLEDARATTAPGTDDTAGADSSQATGGGAASTGGGAAATGGDAATTSGAATGPDAAEPESLVLRARGEEFTVVDGETVGREVRRLVTETGGDTDDAVLVHREHVRFVREAGQFHLVDLGDNPTALNGSRLSKGDREPVEPGDEVDLSGVVTLSVEAP